MTEQCDRMASAAALIPLEQFSIHIKRLYCRVRVLDYINLRVPKLVCVKYILSNSRQICLYKVICKCFILFLQMRKVSLFKFRVQGDFNNPKAKFQFLLKRSTYSRFVSFEWVQDSFTLNKYCYSSILIYLCS